MPILLGDIHGIDWEGVRPWGLTEDPWVDSDKSPGSGLFSSVKTAPFLVWVINNLTC